LEQTSPAGAEHGAPGLLLEQLHAEPPAVVVDRALQIGDRERERAEVKIIGQARVHPVLPPAAALYHLKVVGNGGPDKTRRDPVDEPLTAGFGSKPAGRDVQSQPTGS